MRLRGEVKKSKVRRNGRNERGKLAKGVTKIKEKRKSMRHESKKKKTRLRGEVKNTK